MRRAFLAIFTSLAFSTSASTAFAASASSSAPPRSVQEVQQIIRDAFAPLGLIA
jgi:hypothetical protein